MANYQKIASGSVGIITCIAALAYSAHIYASHEYQKVITADLYGRIADEMTFKDFSTPRHCSGLSMIPSEVTEHKKNNCFDDQGYRFVRIDDSIRIYKPKPAVSLIAELNKKTRHGITINYYGDQQTISDFKEKFFLPNAMPTLLGYFNTKN